MFFVAAAIICAAAGATILAPGTVIDGMWSVKPQAHRTLLAAPWSGVGFALLAGMMLLAGAGCLARMRWGWRLAIAIFAMNGLGDAIRIFAGSPLEGTIGVAVTAVLVFVLTRSNVKASFTQPLSPHP